MNIIFHFESGKKCSIVTVNSKQYAFKYTEMIDGRGYSWTNTRGTQTTMPSPPSVGTAAIGRTIYGTGNIGSGAAKITYVNPNGATATATWNKKATMHIYVNYKDIDGNNIASPIDQIYDPEESYCYYGPGTSITSHRVVNRIEISPDSYDICGTTADEDIHITYYYDWDEHTVITMYLDQYENYEEIDSSKYDTYRHNAPYSTSCIMRF